MSEPELDRIYTVELVRAGEEIHRTVVNEPDIVRATATALNLLNEPVWYGYRVAKVAELGR